MNDRSPSLLQRGVAAILFAAIIVGSNIRFPCRQFDGDESMGLSANMFRCVDLAYVRLIFSDRSILRRQYTALPDQQTPSYPQFLREVRARTERGSSIAILVPMRYWNEGYAYAFYRASYFLAGRRVVPLVSPDDQTHLPRASETDYIAAWDIGARVPEERVIWRGHDGFLVRKAR